MGQQGRAGAQERLRLRTAFSAREAQLLARILDRQSEGQGYRCAGPAESALARSLRIRGMIERLMTLRKSHKALWRVTAWGLMHPAILEGGAVYAQMGETARAKYGKHDPQPAEVLGLANVERYDRRFDPAPARHP